jgi:peroxiredoxin
MTSRNLTSAFGFLLTAILVWAVLALESFQYDAIPCKEKTIADFQLRNVDGRNSSLADYPAAKGFIIVFTSNHCPFAKLYTERLNDLYSKYAPLDVPLLAINSMDTVVYQDETFGKMREKAIAGSFAFPYLYDSEQTVGKNFGAQYTPHAFVLWKEDDQWKVKYSGAIDDNGAEPAEVNNAYVDNALQELLSGHPVAIADTRSIGCAIYYRHK